MYEFRFTHGNKEFGVNCPPIFAAVYFQYLLETPAVFDLQVLENGVLIFTDANFKRVREEKQNPPGKPAWKSN